MHSRESSERHVFGAKWRSLYFDIVFSFIKLSVISRQTHCSLRGAWKKALNEVGYIAIFSFQITLYSLVNHKENLTLHHKINLGPFLCTPSINATCIMHDTRYPQSWTKLLVMRKVVSWRPKTPSLKRMAQQYDYSDSLPLFNVEFGKLLFKGKHKLCRDHKQHWFEGRGEAFNSAVTVTVFHKEALNLNNWQQFCPRLRWYIKIVNLVLQFSARS